jgi:hypothetical protein
MIHLTRKIRHTVATARLARNDTRRAPGIAAIHTLMHHYILAPYCGGHDTLQPMLLQTIRHETLPRCRIVLIIFTITLDPAAPYP